MQDLFKMLDERGYLNKFELEKNESDGFVKAYIDGQLLSGMPSKPGPVSPTMATQGMPAVLQAAATPPATLPLAD